MHARTDAERRHRRDEDGMAIGRGARGRLCGDDGAGARTIFDDDRPFQLILQLLRQHARENVGAAAGRKRTDEGHVPLRIVVDRCLRARGVDRSEAETESQTERQCSFHCPSLALRTVGCAARYVVAMLLRCAREKRADSPQGIEDIRADAINALRRPSGEIDPVWPEAILPRPQFAGEECRKVR